jgi:hypothetical protein
MINRTGRAMLAAAASVALVAGATTAAQATTAAGSRGGYLVTMTTVQSARVALHVPKVNCAKATKSGSLRIGLFGTSGDQSWYLAVIASCHGGQASYLAKFSQDVGQPSLIAHRGDLIRLSIKPGPEYEIDDVTTGEGEGGASAGSGGTPALHHVTVGGHVQGTFPAGARTILRAAKVNKMPLAKVHHQRQVQKRDGAKIVVAGPLNPAGASFDLTTR